MSKELKAALLLFIAPIPGAAIVGTYLIVRHFKNKKANKTKEEVTK